VSDALTIRAFRAVNRSFKKTFLNNGQQLDFSGKFNKLNRANSGSN